MLGGIEIGGKEIELAILQFTVTTQDIGGIVGIAFLVFGIVFFIHARYFFKDDGKIWDYKGAQEMFQGIGFFCMIFGIVIGVFAFEIIGVDIIKE